MDLQVYVEGGRIQNKYVAPYVRALQDGRYRFIIRKGGKRTERQNNYYWFILELIGNEVGYSKDDLHDIFRNMYLKENANDEVFGDIVKIKSTSSLTTVDMMEYVDKIIMWASEYGIIVPDPDPYLYPPKFKRNA